MGREMWNYAELGAHGAGANKYADLVGVLIDGSCSGSIVERHSDDNRYFTRGHRKAGTIAVASLAICRAPVPPWLNAAPPDAAYLQIEMK